MMDAPTHYLTSLEADTPKWLSKMTMHGHPLYRTGKRESRWSQMATVKTLNTAKMLTIIIIKKRAKTFDCAGGWLEILGENHGTWAALTEITASSGSQRKISPQF